MGVDLSGEWCPPQESFKKLFKKNVKGDRVSMFKMRGKGVGIGRREREKRERERERERERDLLTMNK